MTPTPARTPPNAPFEPEFVAALKHLFEERIAFNKVLGLEITEIAPGGVRARLAMRPELIGHYGHQRLHGGVISATLDALGGLAVMAALGARHLDEPPAARMMRFARLGTIDLRIDYLRQASARTCGRAQALAWAAASRRRGWSSSAPTEASHRRRGLHRQLRRGGGRGRSLRRVGVLGDDLPATVDDLAQARRVAAQALGRREADRGCRRCRSGSSSPPSS